MLSSSIYHVYLTLHCLLLYRGFGDDKIKWYSIVNRCPTWRRHQMEKLSTLLAICVGNSPVTGEFPSQRPVTRSIDVFIVNNGTFVFARQWLTANLRRQYCEVALIDQIVFIPCIFPSNPIKIRYINYHPMYIKLHNVQCCSFDRNHHSIFCWCVLLSQPRDCNGTPSGICRLILNRCDWINISRGSTEYISSWKKSCMDDTV